MGSKEEECRVKAQAILRLFGKRATNKDLSKAGLTDRVIALEEYILQEGGAILEAARG